MSGTPWVALRSHNDMPLIGRTLAALAAQDLPHRLLVLDNASTDGTRQAAEKYADRIIDIAKGAYLPGRVLNTAMHETDGDRVVFLNSDCEPEDPRWLGLLFAGLDDPDVAAAFGRQDPRPGCSPLMAKDTLLTFGDGALQARWRHCFSMASSCIRRSVWEAMPFSWTLKYSEDIDWTWRARRAGWEIHYVAGAGVLHSHNYSLAQLRKRQYGEGYAEAEIFEWDPEKSSFLRFSLLPWGKSVLSDAVWCLKRLKLSAALSSPVVRGAMAAGRRAGFQDGTRDLEARHRKNAAEACAEAAGLPFAPLGSVAFNERFGKALEGVAAALKLASGDALAGMVLCGGYGRGEGAVISDPDGREYAWNDVDLLPVARPGRLPALQEALKGARQLKEAFSAEFRADLDIGRPIDEAGIGKLKPVLLWLETARGHRVIGGEADLFSQSLCFDPMLSPGPVEGEKLLLNRGAGLLMAFAKACGCSVVAYDCSDPGFARRNAAKARLALGDALLMAVGFYETSVPAKKAALSRTERAIRKLLGGQASSFPDFALTYASGIAFKTDPGGHAEEPSREELARLARLWLTCFGATESVRTGSPWPGPAAFARRTSPVEASEHRGARALARNAVHNLRRGRSGLRYPREELFSELPLLLETVSRNELPDSGRLEYFIGLWIRYN